jgi:uncharacterized membrane protein YsdA (DUF1294 family)
MEHLSNFFLLALVFVNVLAFILMWIDKQRSLKGEERAPEIYFFLWAAMFGSFGIFFGIFTFRHKTRKIYFPLGIGLLLIQQIVLLNFVFKSL